MLPGWKSLTLGSASYLLTDVGFMSSTFRDFNHLSYLWSTSVLEACPPCHTTQKQFILVLFQPHLSIHFTMLCYFQVYSKVIQLHIHIYLFFQSLFLYRLLQNIEYSSLCYTVTALLVMYFIHSCMSMLIPNP